MTPLVLEIVASVIIAFCAGWLLFDSFFDDWSDYSRCIRAQYFLLSWRDDREERAQALAKLFVYKALSAGAGVGAFFLLRKLSNRT
jgi:hypothetical protein